jgi:hypothetical protein
LTGISNPVGSCSSDSAPAKTPGGTIKREEFMKSDITRRDALALGVSAAALAATGAAAQGTSNVKAADVAAP